MSSRASPPGHIPALLFPAFWPWTSERPCLRSLTGQTGIKVPTPLFWGLNKLMQESTQNSAGPCNHMTSSISISIIGTTILHSKVWSAIMCYHNEVLLWNCHSANLMVLNLREDKGKMGWNKQQMIKWQSTEVVVVKEATKDWRVLKRFHERGGTWIGPLNK